MIRIGEEVLSGMYCDCGEFLYSTPYENEEDEELYMLWYCKKCGYSNLESL
jgi:C4-type Zn-finger protein